MDDTRFKRNSTCEKSVILAHSLTILLGILGQGLREAGQATTLKSARAKIFEADRLAEEIALLALAIAKANGSDHQ